MSSESNASRLVALQSRAALNGEKKKKRHEEEEQEEEEEEEEEEECV